MKIFKCIVSKEELLSDSYKIKEVDGVIYEVDAAVKTLGTVDVNIGANASAEEPEEQLEEQSEKVIDIVHNFRLMKISHTKDSYKHHIRSYLKKVKQYLQANNTPEEEISKFEQGAKISAQRFMSNIKDYDFYTSQALEAEGMVILLNYRDDGITPYLSFWKHGLIEEKV